MRVRDIMSKNVETISSGEYAVYANEVMWRKQIHHLVVVDGPRIVGVISDTDLGGPEADTIPDNLKVKDVMSEDVISVKPTTLVKTAVNIMKSHGIKCLPVVMDGQLTGILTATDLANLQKRGSSHGPYDGLELHQGPYVPQHIREARRTSCHVHWPS